MDREVRPSDSVRRRGGGARSRMPSWQRGGVAVVGGGRIFGVRSATTGSSAARSSRAKVAVAFGAGSYRPGERRPVGGPRKTRRGRGVDRSSAVGAVDLAGTVASALGPSVGPAAGVSCGALGVGGESVGHLSDPS